MPGEAAAKPSSPDRHSHGFVTGTVDPLQYDYDEQAKDPDEVIGIISRMVPAGARVLDVGCGAGACQYTHRKRTPLAHRRRT
jgi:2-polyprenyl-3-methyl-5-hydroxy-6-metoxy-1,4-benzoquinol methylase